MEGVGGELRGRGLLSKIRFCVMDAEYLSVGVHRLLPAEHADWIYGLVLEALRIKDAGRQGELVGARLLGEAYEQEGRQIPRCLAVIGSKLISGSADNGDADEAQRYEVRAWDLGTLECEHTLPQAAGAEVRCLAAGCGAVWGGVGSEVVVWGWA